MLDSRAWTRRTGTEEGRLASTDFFGLLQEDIDKINKFFLGKLASLRVDLEAMTANSTTVVMHTTRRAMWICYDCVIFMSSWLLCALSGAE